MTVGQISRRIGQSRAFTAAMLEDWQRAGVVREVNGRWAMTEHGMKTFGAAILAADPTQGARG